jgi:hypothetical protein
MLATMTLNASDAKDVMIEKLLREVRELKNSVSELKYEQSLIKEAQLKNSSNEMENIKRSIEDIKIRQDENERYSDEIMEYAEFTETRTLEDKLKFGVGFKTCFNNFDKKYVDGTTANSNIFSNKLMFNVKADITKDMKFYSRLSMYKSWGDGNRHIYSYYDNMQGRVPSDSSLYVERAYLDWFFNRDGQVPIALTIGRQPSGDGPSQHFKDNISRKATYSSLLYDGAADGAILTFNLSNILDIDKSYLRLGYAKGYGYSESSPNLGNAFVGPANNDIEDTNVYGVFLDTTIPWLRHSLVQVSYSRLNDIVANPLDTDLSQNKNIGDADMMGAMVEVTDLNHNGLDLFLHYGYTTVKPNMESYMTYGGLLSSVGDTSQKNGYSIWCGTRYAFGDDQNFKLGLEYNHGSKNWISLTQGSYDVYNKLATRGDAYEAYLMYVINRYSNIRFGFIDINYDYSRSGWFVGESISLDDPLASNSEVKSLQSIYLKMSVKY